MSELLTVPEVADKSNIASMGSQTLLATIPGFQIGTPLVDEVLGLSSVDLAYRLREYSTEQLCQMFKPLVNDLLGIEYPEIEDGLLLTEDYLLEYTPDVSDGQGYAHTDYRFYGLAVHFCGKGLEGTKGTRDIELLTVVEHLLAAQPSLSLSFPSNVNRIHYGKTSPGKVTVFLAGPPEWDYDSKGPRTAHCFKGSGHYLRFGWGASSEDIDINR